MPRVTLLILLGVLLGPMALAEVALAMVGFLLGGEFTRANLVQRGKAVVVVSLAVVVVTMALVTAGMVLLGVALPAALVLGTAATATDPAAVDAVCRERPEGPLTSLLRGVVAVDDVWGMLLFAVVLSAIDAMAGGPLGAEAMVHAVRELGGSLGLGAALGAAMAAVTGRLTPGEPTRMEALGFVLLSCGLASWLGLSYLLTAVAMGAAVANLATHHETTFRELEAIETPFLVLFFVLSGATADVTADPEVWLLVTAYLTLRTLGRIAGGWVGVRSSDPERGAAIGFALLPQAGVALGMTLVAVERLPELAWALPVVVLSTVVFESLGPVATAWVVDRENHHAGG